MLCVGGSSGISFSTIPVTALFAMSRIGFMLPRPILWCSCKAQSLPFKTGRTRATTQLELIHDDLVCHMPVVSVSRRKYGFVVMDEYSPASWMLPLRAKSDAPTELEIWAKDGERNGESCLTTRIVEPVEGRNREYCGHKESRGNTPVPHSPSSNGNLLA